MPFDFQLEKEIWTSQGSITVQLLSNPQNFHPAPWLKRKLSWHKCSHTKLQFLGLSTPKSYSYSDVEILHCIWNLSLNLCLSVSPSLFLTHTHTNTHYRMVVNASGTPVLWRVNERGFIYSSILNSTTTTFLQAYDGLVVSEDLLALGQNYFLSKINSVSPSSKQTF